MMSTMNHYIAIDHTGCTSRIMLCDDTQILHQGKGDVMDPACDVWRYIQDLVQCSLKAASVGREEVTRLVIGSNEMEGSQLKELLAGFLPHTEIMIASRQELFLAGSLRGAAGIVVVADDCSIAFGRNAQGTILHTGGYGWRLGDEGSSYWLAKEAIRRTLAATELRDIPSSLEAVICSFFQMEEIREAIPLVNDPATKKTTIAKFAPFVTKAALNGDELALDIEKQGSEALAELVFSITKKLRPPFTKTVICNGNSFNNDLVLYQFFTKRMKERLPSYHVSLATPQCALEGAMFLAKEEK